jgi:hypothetical protein
MNKNTKIVLTLLALGLVLSCKQSRASEESADYSESAITDSTSVISSSAAVVDKTAIENLSEPPM